MYIPIAGPFIAIGTAEPDPGVAVGLAALGVAQLGGVAMIVAGLAFPKTTLVRDADRAQTVRFGATMLRNGAGAAVIVAM
jgi:hypothetical protein